MKKRLFILIVLSFQSILAQEDPSSYFVIDGEKFDRPIKYVMFDSKINTTKIVKNKKYFYIQNETFITTLNKSKIDTCDLTYVNMLKFEKVEELAHKEYLFYNQTIESIENWQEKMLGPPPPVSEHKYFKLFIIEEQENEYIIYDVVWPVYHGIM